MTTGKNSEVILWDSFRNGSEKDLYTLYTRYYADLLRYGLKLSGDPELSKDFINRLFLDLWNKKDTLPDVAHPLAYIVTCYKNKVLFRKEKKSPLTIALSPSDMNNAATVAAYEETLIELQEYEQLRQSINRLLGMLSERQKQLVEMKYLEELSYEEIAARLNISIRTVYNSIHESLKLLRKEPSS